MDNNRLLQMLTYYKQTLADVLEENFMFKATIQELKKEIQTLKDELENDKKE